MHEPTLPVRRSFGNHGTKEEKGERQFVSNLGGHLVAHPPSTAHSGRTIFLQIPGVKTPG
jgi:hypothetical protein